MSQGVKRRLDQTEGPSVNVDVGAYNISSDEYVTLKKCTSERPKFSRHSPANTELDTVIKMSALKAAQSIVSLVSFSGETMLSQACGTIIESVDHVNTVLTSLSLLRQPCKAIFMENTLATNLKVIVNCPDEWSYLGEIETYDFHYNLLVIKFKSMSSMQVGNLNRSFHFQPKSLQSLSREFNPDESLVVVGRYFYQPFDLMAAPGKIRFKCFYSRTTPISYSNSFLNNSQLHSTCNITRCGDGSPLLNLNGEIIGLAYYLLGAASPILPIEVAYKWWSHYKEFKESRHPAYGFNASNMYSTAPVSILARVQRAFPSISNGLLVQKVQVGSSAEVAGLCNFDIITKCDGKPVDVFLELWRMLWDKVGGVVELEVVRVDDCSTLSISFVVEEGTLEKLNKWPRYEYR